MNVLDIRVKALEQAVISFTYLEQPRVGSVSRQLVHAKKITDRAQVFERYLSGKEEPLGFDPSLS